jgi:hypothetical protein
MYNIDFGKADVIIKYPVAQVYNQSHTCYLSQDPYQWKDYSTPAMIPA